MKLNPTYIGLLSMIQADFYVFPNTCPEHETLSLLPGAGGYVCPELTCSYTYPYEEVDMGLAEDYDDVLELGAFEESD